jgi:hypothetical protein
MKGDVEFVKIYPLFEDILLRLNSSGKSGIAKRKAACTG